MTLDLFFRRHLLAPVVLAFWLSASLFMAGCQTLGGNPFDKLFTPSAGGSSFNTALKNEYEALAVFADSVPQTKGAGGRFLEKAAQAGRGEQVMPDKLESRELSVFARDELTRARASLLNVLANRNSQAPLAAMAQAKFDCWLLYQNLQRKKEGYIGCRESFFEALALLEQAQPLSSSAPAVTAAGPQRFDIVFEGDGIKLDDDIHETLEQVAALAATMPEAPVVMVGHTKAKVKETDTSNSAVRRILAVRNALYQKGIERERVSMRFERSGDARDVEIHVGTDEGPGT